jgi:chromate transporter
LPQVAGVLYGVKPVVIALIVQAVWKLGRSALKSVWLMVVGAVAVFAFARGVDELAVLAAGGLLAGMAQGVRSRRQGKPSPAVLSVAGMSGAVVAVPFGLGALFLVFLKIGAILFGGGYVLVALIRSNLVARLGWRRSRSSFLPLSSWRSAVHWCRAYDNRRRQVRSWMG